MKVFDANVTIDARERSLMQIFDENGVEGHIVEFLPLGDVQCIYTDGADWLLERKTASDFEASMRDGRYFSEYSSCTALRRMLMCYKRFRNSK